MVCRRSARWRSVACHHGTLSRIGSALVSARSGECSGQGPSRPARRTLSPRAGASAVRDSSAPRFASMATSRRLRSTCLADGVSPRRLRVAGSTNSSSTRSPMTLRFAAPSSRRRARPKRSSGRSPSLSRPRAKTSRATPSAERRPRQSSGMALRCPRSSRTSVSRSTPTSSRAASSAPRLGSGG